MMRETGTCTSEERQIILCDANKEWMLALKAFQEVLVHAVAGNEQSLIETLPTESAEARSYRLDELRNSLNIACTHMDSLTKL